MMIDVVVNVVMLVIAAVGSLAFPRATRSGADLASICVHGESASDKNAVDATVSSETQRTTDTATPLSVVGSGHPERQEAPQGCDAAPLRRRTGPGGLRLPRKYLGANYDSGIGGL